jgi:hypothetical protein
MTGPNFNIPGVRETVDEHIRSVASARKYLAALPALPDVLELAREIYEAWLPLHNISERAEELETLVELADLPHLGVTESEVQQARDLVAYLHRLIDLTATNLSGFRVEHERVVVQRDLRTVLNCLTGAEALAMIVAAHDTYNAPDRSAA